MSYAKVNRTSRTCLAADVLPPPTGPSCPYTSVRTMGPGINARLLACPLNTLAYDSGNGNFGAIERQHQRPKRWECWQYWICSSQFLDPQNSEQHQVPLFQLVYFKVSLRTKIISAHCDVRIPREKYEKRIESDAALLVSHQGQHWSCANDPELQFHLPMVD